MSQIAKANEAVQAACRTGGKRLIVLGGGLSGLSYVHYIRNFMAAIGKGRMIDKITILEANDYMGGSVKTHRFQDGSLHELGPRMIRVAGVRASNTVSLMEQLCLNDKVVPIRIEPGKEGNKLIYNENKLSKLNISFFKLFTKLPNCKRTTLAQALLRDCYRANKLDLSQYPEGDPSLYDFIKHRFGEEPADMILDPIMRTINGCVPNKLSTRALFSDILDKEQAYGSVIKGLLKPPVTKMPHDELFPNDILKSNLLDELQKNQKVLGYSISTGLQTIPEYLSNSLLNTNEDNLISIFNQTKVKSIQFTDYANRGYDGGAEAACSILVETIDGDHVKIDGDYIISTIPAPDFSKLLNENTIPASSHNRNVLDDIINIAHVPIGSVCVEYKKLSKLKQIKNMRTLGILTHSNSDSKLLSINFDCEYQSKKEESDNSDRYMISCNMGGSWFEETFKTNDPTQVTDAQMEQVALEEISKILKVNDEPYRISSIMWKSGYPVYTPGHKERLDRVRDELDRLGIPLILLGQSYDGLAMNDVIFTARVAAYNFVKALASHSTNIKNNQQFSC